MAAVGPRWITIRYAAAWPPYAFVVGLVMLTVFLRPGWLGLDAALEHLGGVVRYLLLAPAIGAFTVSALLLVRPYARIAADEVRCVHPLSGAERVFEGTVRMEADTILVDGERTGLSRSMARRADWAAAVAHLQGAPG